MGTKNPSVSVQSWHSTTALTRNPCSGSTASRSSTAPEGAGDSPGVWFLVSVVQRLEALLLLLLAEAGGIGDFEESGREFNKPAGIDGRYFPHILLGGQHQLVVHNPVKREAGY